MCGIFLFANSEPIVGKRRTFLEKAASSIKHRGPDSTRIRYYNSNVMIAFHRLAIVDQSDKGMQPFSNERFVLVANGEIYNYRELIQKCDYKLKSESDCEVILHEFLRIIGDRNPEIEDIKQLCKTLDGEFTFIIYDIQKDDIYFAVDELRTRPLFMSHLSPFFALSSEQKSLLDLDLNIEIVPPGTVGMRKYREALFASYDLVIESYFEYAPKSIMYFDKRGTANKLRELLINSVKKKLHASRKACFLLSGGLDSSLIAGIAASLSFPDQIRTFTVGFDENATDVLAARKVAKHINSIHYEFIFPFSSGYKLLRDVIYNTETWDQTTIRASTPMLLLIKQIKAIWPDIVIIFSGELSDEMFMGYAEWKQTNDVKESIEHVWTRLKQVSQFDGLRADRIVSSQGCELRLPFFDKEILEFLKQIDPVLLMPHYNKGDINFLSYRESFGSCLKNEPIEKYLLRLAFSETDILPKEILWRTKHAFSDATSIVGANSWKEFLKSKAEEEITDSRFSCRDKLYPYQTPQTKEDMMYREIFEEFGFNAECIPCKWLPKWSGENITDASATVLNVFSESSVL